MIRETSNSKPAGSEKKTLGFFIKFPPGPARRSNRCQLLPLEPNLLGHVFIRSHGKGGNVDG